jgi:hypothetical protein
MTSNGIEPPSPEGAVQGLQTTRVRIAHGATVVEDDLG